jgi:hypothetical protein
MSESNYPYPYPYGNNIYNHNELSPILSNRDIQEPQLSNNRTSSTISSSSSASSSYFTSPPIYGTHSQFTPTRYNGICDRMNDCHLTDPWINYMKQHVNFPITHIANQIPILNSYVPLSSAAFELKTSYPNNNYYHHDHNLMQNSLLSGMYLNEHYKCLNMTDDSEMPAHPQQQLFCDGFSHRHSELDYEETNDDHQQNKPEQNNDIYENSKTMSPTRRNSKDNRALSDEDRYHHRLRIKTSIKFQDRNKKLDFKTNFRDENRKVNRCFYDNEKLSPKNIINGHSAPKKKWIKHYMKNNSGDFS